MKHYWGRPMESKKFHIFPEPNFSTSLCGKWMFTPDKKQPKTEVICEATKEDCKECVKRFNKMIEKASKESA